MGIEKIVKDILKNSKIEPKKSNEGWVYEAGARGNPYEDFRDEYEGADMIDVGVASRALPNEDRDEKYFVVMSSKQSSKAKLKEIHNARFAQYSGNDLIVKGKEDVVADLMNKYGIKPDFPDRPTIPSQPVPNPCPEPVDPCPPIDPYPGPGPITLYNILPPGEFTIKYGIPYPPHVGPITLYNIPKPNKPCKPNKPYEPVAKYGFLGPKKPTVYRYGITGPIGFKRKK